MDTVAPLPNVTDTELVMLDEVLEYMRLDPLGAGHDPDSLDGALAALTAWEPVWTARRAGEILPLPCVADVLRDMIAQGAQFGAENIDERACALLGRIDAGGVVIPLRAGGRHERSE